MKVGRKHANTLRLSLFPPISPPNFVRLFVWFVRIVNETSERVKQSKKFESETAETQKDQDKRYIPVAVAGVEVEDEDDDVGGIIISVVADGGGGWC